MQQPDMPELADIQVFVALADTGSFVAAATRVGRDPTVVSRRLQGLEARLGVRLAERTTRRVVLTEAGLAYLSRIRPLLGEIEDAGREAATFADGEPRGSLRLALPTSFARLWLTPLVVGFAKAYPNVAIDASHTNRFVDLVAERYDIAVRLAVLPDSRLVARKVADRRRLVCASPGYLARHGPVRFPEEIAGHRCLCFTGRQDCFRWQFTAPDGSPCSVAVARRIASDDADMLVEAALAGLGLFYTTDWHVGPHLADGRLVEVLADWPVPDRGGIYVVTPSVTGMPTKTRAFSDWIAQGLSPPPWVGGP